MIGTHLIEQLVQSVAISHRVRGHERVSLLLIAAPESGKTTIATAANARHVLRVAVISGKSVIRELHDHPQIEFLLMNDLTCVRAMSTHAVNLLINLLNQLTQGETGIVAFAGKDAETINRPLGILACIPFETFTDHRARWKELGFVSRMLPFAYKYPAELVAEIKDAIDSGVHVNSRKPSRAMPKTAKSQIEIACHARHTRRIRALADARAVELRQLGIRLLRNYHCLVRAHALLDGRTKVIDEDIRFLRAVDTYVSIQRCEDLALNGDDTRPRHAPIRG